MLGKTLPIKDWHTAERPRDKIFSSKPSALCPAELLAILIGSGNRHHNALDLAKEILATVQNNLNELGKCNMNDLLRIRGIGKAKAAAIVAALELGRRRQSATALERKYIQNSRQAAEYIRPLLEDQVQENFGVLYLKQAGWIHAFDIISEGGMTSTVVDTRIILKKALEYNAAAMVCFHNHPSGSLRPSIADESLTKKLHSASTAMDIKLLDHIIIGDRGYFSFADAGLLDANK